MSKSGGVKYDDNKPMMSLLSPKGILEEAKGMSYGAGKYGQYNWRKGIAVSRYLNAALRHIWQHITGETIDPEKYLWTAELWTEIINECREKK